MWRLPCSVIDTVWSGRYLSTFRKYVHLPWRGKRWGGYRLLLRDAVWSGNDVFFRIQCVSRFNTTEQISYFLSEDGNKFGFRNSSFNRKDTMENNIQGVLFVIDRRMAAITVCVSGCRARETSRDVVSLWSGWRDSNTISEEYFPWNHMQGVGYSATLNLGRSSRLNSYLSILLSLRAVGAVHPFRHKPSTGAT